MSGLLGGEFLTPRGIAIDSASGNVYVVERGSGGARVQAFTADGGFLWMAGKDVVEEGGPGNVSTPPILANERQGVGLAGPFDLGCFCSAPITGGTFTLTFDGQTTGGIPYNASAAQVKAALENLSNVDTVTVTGGPGPSSAWTVEFTGTHAGVDVPQMTLDASGLVPAGAFGSVSTSQNGSTTSDGPAEVCTVAATCKAAAIGSKGGEFGAGGASSSNGGGNGIAVVPDMAPNGGNILVTDSGNRRVQELASIGGFREWRLAGCCCQGCKRSGERAVFSVRFGCQHGGRFDARFGLVQGRRWA